MLIKVFVLLFMILYFVYGKKWHGHSSSSSGSHEHHGRKGSRKGHWPQQYSNNYGYQPHYNSYDNSGIDQKLLNRFSHIHSAKNEHGDSAFDSVEHEEHLHNTENGQHVHKENFAPPNHR
uniref:Uncharacterized protein n=1 Tax=Rhabditophanes sp. KR3021 TaxID=114890 RepID=A0AC35UI82_9BILA